jgi:hypothetical protein
MKPGDWKISLSRIMVSMVFLAGAIFVLRLHYVSENPIVCRPFPAFVPMMILLTSAAIGALYGRWFEAVGIGCFVPIVGAVALVCAALLTAVAFEIFKRAFGS